MNTPVKFVTAAVGTVVASVAAPALLFLGAGTAQAIQDISEVIDPGNTVGIDDPDIRPPLIIDPGLTLGVDDPGIRPPQIIDPGIKVGIVDPGLKVGIVDPGLKVGIVDPGLKVGLGGPDTRPPR